MHLRSVLGLLLLLLGSVNCLKRKKITCDECYVEMQGLIDVINSGATREIIVEKYLDTCTNYYQQQPLSCDGLSERNVDVLIYVVREKFGTEFPVTTEAICYFENYPSCPSPGPQYDWTLDLDFLGPKPALENPQLPPDGSPTLEVLQITDLHLDPTYTPGNNALCGFYSCCRASQGVAPNSSSAAGYWGDYRGCDMPVHAFQNLLDQTVLNHPDLSYIMFTGDVIDHANWERTVESNSAHFQLAMDMLKTAFPGKPVLPILGNHESMPANRAPPTDWNVPENFKNQWLYQLAADTWAQWVPGSESTILRGGFYAFEVNPGLKIIALNNNFCYTSNWWLLYENYDPSGQLMWLAEQLLSAEQLGQKVHILAHIPLGISSSWSVCSREYRRIIDRFQNTVVAQFHGHTHRDHFNIYYDLDEPSTATGLAFVGGSATSYRDYNPNYRVYQVDGSYQGASFRVLDHSTWFFNLTEANLAGAEVEPNWQKLYSFKEAYGVNSMFPADMDLLVQQMAQNATLQEMYHRFYVTAGDPSLEAGCDVQCLQKIVCDIVKTVVTDDCSRLPFKN